MKLISPKSFSWIVYGTTAALISVMVVAAVTYRKSLYWENRFQEQQIREIEQYEALKDVTLLLSNSDMENSLLISDYFFLDSLLISEKNLNAGLNRELISTYSRYKEALNKNEILNNQLDIVLEKNDLLNNELYKSRVELAEAMESNVLFMEALKNREYVDSGELFTVDFLTRYNLIDIHATGIQDLRRGEKNTKRIKQTDYILITTKTVSGLNFDLGDKTIYFRIADPEGNILPFMKDEVDLFRFQGDEILFSEKQQIRFSDSNLPLRIAYHPVTQLTPGVYWVYAFCDGIRIGEASFDLF